MLTDARPVEKPGPYGVSRSKSYSAAVSWVGWFLVGVGCALRIREYIANRSVTIDEAFLALNLIEKSPRELLGTLALDQAAPQGFLMAEKAAILLLGRSEYALRLVPLIASLLAVVVFYPVAQRILRPGAATLAVGVFALLDPLVLYAATTKQYALDVAAAVLILATAVFVQERSLRYRDLAATAVLGAILLWFSHAAAFGLAALGVILLLDACKRRGSRSTLPILFVIAFWVTSFATAYFLSKSGLEQVRSAFQRGDVDAFARSSGGLGPVDSLDRLRYLVGLEDASSGQQTLASAGPANRVLTSILLIVAIAGFASISRRNARIGLMLALPPAAAGVAAALDLYPLVGRSLLFALPSVALCLGEGLSLPARARSGWARALAVGVTVVCLGAISVLPAYHAIHERGSQDVREALGYLGAKSKPTDGLYVSSGAQYALAYYHLCECSPFDPAMRWPFSTQLRKGSTSAIESRSPRLVVESGSLEADVVPLLGSERAWFLLAELWGPDRAKRLEKLKARGALTERFETRGPLPARASLHLFDLRTSR